MRAVRKFQTVSLAIYLLASTALVVLSLRASDGHLVYSLDDPYIHLAVAENILKGGYGVNLSEYSSPSSSILWPLLMALALGLGLGSLAPLIVGLIASAASVWLISGFFWRHAFGETAQRSAKWALILMPSLLILSINAIALPMTGMEHPLHILATILVILGLESLAGQNRASPALLLGVVLCPLIRFEGAALSLAAIAALAWRKKYAQAIALSLILIALLGAYVITMNSLGLPALPSSVMRKSGVAAATLEGGAYLALYDVLMNVKASSATLGEISS